MSYEDNFDAYKSGERPKYFSDQMGGFEIFDSGNGNKTLRQSVPAKPVCWWNDYEPFSFVGNRGLSNFTVSADAMIETEGYAAIYGRVTGPKYGQTHPFGYGMRIDQNNNWQLTVYKDRGNEQYGTYFEVLESGVIKGISAEKWVNLKLKFMGREISGYVDNKKIFEYFDEQNSYPTGRAGVGSNYSYVQFDNFKITNLDTDDSFVKIDDSEEGAPITYTDGWAKWAGQGYKETVHYVEQPGQEATFKFNGVRARYYGFKRNDLGIIDILVDGVKKETIDLYSEGESMDVMLYETEVLPKGEHTLTIRTTNQKNAASSGTEVIIDAISFSTEPPKVVAPEQVLLNESSLVMKVGESFRLFAAVLPDNATNGKVIWSSVNSDIASVSEYGTITAMKEGKTNIVATTEDGKKTASCEVTVVGSVDKTALNALLTECESLREADYTAESWKTFKSAYDAAKAIADNTGATQEQVDSAVSTLRAAKNALDVSGIPNTSDVYIATYLIMAGASAFGVYKLRKKGKMKI